MVQVKPRYCGGCGQPFPWTETALSAARQLAEIELAQAEQNELADIVEKLVRDAPQTTVAVTRFKRIMAKAGPAVADGFKAILVNVVTEAVKKAVFPTP